MGLGKSFKKAFGGSGVGVGLLGGLVAGALTGGIGLLGSMAAVQAALGVSATTAGIIGGGVGGAIAGSTLGTMSDQQTRAAKDQAKIEQATAEREQQLAYNASLTPTAAGEAQNVDASTQVDTDTSTQADRSYSVSKTTMRSRLGRLAGKTTLG